MSPQSNNGRKTFIANAAIVRGVRVQFHATRDNVVVTGLGVEGIGTTTEAAGAGEHVGVRLDNHTVEVRASGAITQGSDNYAAAAGAMSVVQSGRRQGIAMEPAADAEIYEMMPVWAS